MEWISRTSRRQMSVTSYRAGFQFVIWGILSSMLGMACLAQTSDDPGQPAAQPFYDRSHFSEVFGQQRFYRIFLPPGYNSSEKRYPVVYYFHGHSDRYTLEHYDDGEDTVPKIARTVTGRGDFIVVSVDGYVAEHYTGFYGGNPWDVRKGGTDEQNFGSYDFGRYFLELVDHIDRTYRTLTDRRHRATSGLSMGGFMSLYLSARYPDLIGSASSFNPGPEFYIGEKKRRVLWRPKDHVSSHAHSMVRLIRASGDYISQYHEETRAAYARAEEVDFEFRQDEYHRHWATSIGETFDFHRRAFERSSLDNVPVEFHYANPYLAFEVWGYQITCDGEAPGYTYLKSVRQDGMRITTREWAPDGSPVSARRIRVVTPPRYKAGATYSLLDRDLSKAKTVHRELVAGEEGRLTFEVDGGGHQISFFGPGAGAHPPVLLPVTAKDKLLVEPGKEIILPLSIYNPRNQPMTDVEVQLTSDYPTVLLAERSATVPKIEPGEAVDLSEHFPVRFVGGARYLAPARIDVRFTYDGWHSSDDHIDLMIIPEVLNEPAAVEILDGRTVTLPVFRQAGNQGGGTSVEREVTEGSGNGNGRLEPWERATIWVKMVQGMDPFDKNNWYRTKIRTDSPWVKKVGDIQEVKQREWTGAQGRTSLIQLSSEVPPGTEIELLLENETWSFHYTPDVRYGEEPLYQAFQLHRPHLHRYRLVVR